MTKIIHDYEMNLKNEGNFHFFEKKLLKCIFQPAIGQYPPHERDSKPYIQTCGVTPSLPH